MQYFEAIVQAGGIPYLVPLVDDPEGLRALFDRADGVLLIGGEDVGPTHYGAPPHPKLGTTSPRRDALELAFARWCRKERKPIFGICRGMQLLNVAWGGTLYQDLPSERGVHHLTPIGQDPSVWAIPTHTITLEADSALASWLGCESIPVNSFHHQAVCALAPGLRAVAHSPNDGIIEGVEAIDPARFVLGLQCHPEALFEETDRRWLRCFAALVAAAERWSSQS